MEELRRICKRLKKNNIITGYVLNMTKTKFHIYINQKINWNDKELPKRLDEYLTEEFKKKGYNTHNDGLGEILIRL